MTDGVIENFCLILKSKTAYFINCYFYLNRATSHKNELLWNQILPLDRA